jgi:tetratricopeptide (TPR) repeat protein
MTQLPKAIASPNEATYESLISLIENSQEQLALIIVACDDLQLRQQMIECYEREANLEQIRVERIVLGTEPSLRAGLARLALPPAARVVVTVTGAEWLLRVKTRSADEQSDLDKFFGYLQWTREGLREFRHPIVLWVTFPILREMSRKAPDFWSWRKAVLRFTSEASEPIIPLVQEHVSAKEFDRQNDDFLPPPAEILSEIHQLEANNPASANLATLYQKLAEVYAARIARGEVTNLEQEQQQAIDAFERAIELYRKLNDRSALANILNNFGNFLRNQSHYQEAIEFNQQSLDIWLEIGDCDGQSVALHDLGNVYQVLGQYQTAIDYYQQSLGIQHKNSNYFNEASYLNNLGNCYHSTGQYQNAIDSHQKSLEINYKNGDVYGKASSLANLGIIYNSLEQYQKALDFYQQSLEIQREIGDLRGAAGSLNAIGNVYHSIDQSQRAIDFYQQSLEIYRKIGDLYGEERLLHNLANAYDSLAQYQLAIDLSQHSLKIQCKIGDRHGEAKSLFNKARILAKFEPRRFEALDTFKQARTIYAELKLDGEVNKCDEAIYNFNRTITTEQRQLIPTIGDLYTKEDWVIRSLDEHSTTRSTSQGKIHWIVWFCMGLSICVVILLFLRK